MRFGSVIPRKGANFFNTFIMKKISLVNVSPEDGVNFHQLDHVHQMLGALQVLISPSRDIDLREIVVALHKASVMFSILLVQCEQDLTRFFILLSEIP